MKLKDFNETFEEELRDQEYAAAYLQQAMEEGTGAFLVALRDVAKANGGMTQLSEASALGRESMYKSLSAGGNPKISTIQAILKGLGFTLVVTPAKDGRRAA